MDTTTPADISIIGISNGNTVRAVARVHVEAFKDYFNARLGVSYVSAFIRAFGQAKQAIAIAAVDRHDNVLGYAIGAPVSHERMLQRGLYWVCVRSILFRPWLLFDARLWIVGTARLRHLIRAEEVNLSFNLPEPTMSLVAIGVAPSHRRSGIGARLMQEFAERARVLNMRSLLLCVDEDREGIRRFYERCGWQPCGSVDSRGSVSYFSLVNHVNDVVTECIAKRCYAV